MGTGKKEGADVHVFWRQRTENAARVIVSVEGSPESWQMWKLSNLGYSVLIQFFLSWILSLVRDFCLGKYCISQDS